MNIQYKKLHGIYMIKCPLNGKGYVGSATCIYTRWHSHYSLLRRDKHSNVHLQRIVNKHGLGSIIFGVIEFVHDLANLITREQYWLDTLKPEMNICPMASTTEGVRLSDAVKKHLSNIRKGKYPKGVNGQNHTPDARKKISEKAKERFKNWGGPHPNLKAASIAANTGRKHTIEFRARLAKTQRKVTPEMALEILRKRKNGQFQYVIAKEYGISQRLVVRVDKGLGIYGSAEYKDYFEAQERRFKAAIAEPLFEQPKAEQGKLL